MADYVGRSKLWTPRWYPLKAHPIQTALVRSDARFKVVPAGRRSGKTERAKRAGVKKAYTLPPGGVVGFGAPTRDQAKNIFWDDLIKMIPRWMMRGDPHITDLAIRLKTDVEIRVVGMDKPARVEGHPWDWFCLDEFANCKEESWGEHLYPALSTIGREGEAWLIGVPEGRNHYYEMYKRALADDTGEWEGFTWFSSDILPAKTIEAAKRDLDPLTFEQEYEASFINFSGQAYYPFRDDIHANTPLGEKYNPRAPLIFMFDFNVEPGVAAIGQEVTIPDRRPAPEPVIVEGRKLFKDNYTPHHEDIDATAILGEVYIERNSTTPNVCNKLIKDWGDHEGPIHLYGDATGGSRGTAQLHGSDWDLIMDIMYRHFGRDRVHRFGHRNKSTGAWSNPTERSRVNAVNTRLLSGDKAVRLVVDPKHAPHVVRDFEGVRLLEGGSGEIDKKEGEKTGLTHLSDGIGYYIEFRFSTKVGPSSQVFKDAF
jgi:hypothetical protein